MIKLILFFLGKGIKAGYKKDSHIKQLFDNNIGDNNIVKIEILNENPKICFWKDGKNILCVGKNKSAQINSDLTIVFKSKKQASDVLFGKTSIKTAFARHYFLVYGDIATSMSVVDILERVENYLFPSILTKKLLLSDIPRDCSKFSFLLSTIFI